MRRKRQRVPELTQLSATECGATCLAMILNYYGCGVTVEEIRERSGVGRDGLSAHSIVKVARDYGLRVRAVSVQENDLRLVKFPCIVHWEFDHFLVVEHWSPKGVSVVDPAYGRRRLTIKEFDAGFTGVIILLEPGVQFKRRSTSRRLSLRAYLLSSMRIPGAFAQILVASLLLQVLGLVLPALTKVIVDQVVPHNMKSPMAWIGIGILIIVVAQLIVTLLRSRLLVYLQAHIDSRMMLGFFEHMLTLPYSFFQTRSTGDLLNRLNSNTTIRDTFTTQLTSLFLDGSFVLIYFLIILWQAPLFGVLTFTIGLFQVVLLVGTGRRMRYLTQRELAAQGRAQGFAAEVLTGIETLKSMGAEPRAFDRWSNLFFDQLNMSIRRGNVTALIEAMISALRALAPLLLLWVGALQVLNGTLSLGTMLALNSLAALFLAPLMSLTSSGQKLQLVQAYLDRIADVLETEQVVQEVQRPPKLSGCVELKEVGFQYSPNSPAVLNDVNLRIEAGQKIAVVGRTGSGKSTLGKLLIGLYQPTFGRIYYNGLPLQSLNYRELRNQFGVVLQDPFIFSGTIRQNIAFNEPDMPMERVIEVAKIAAIHEDIVRMPMKYETLVAEGGSAISGGQRQRLALARALASSPSILLLDEATSHLDVVTEQIVDKNLDTLQSTRIIIAHRLSTIRNAHLILVLEQGNIVESGTHQELLALNGYYTSLVHNQLEESHTTRLTTLNGEKHALKH